MRGSSRESLGRAAGGATVPFAAVLATVALLAASAPAAAGHTGDKPLPIVFVHGSAGSGAQYASVARRFVSNGYPADRIRTFE